MRLQVLLQGGLVFVAEDATLAQLTAAGEVTEFRATAYTAVARALGLT